MAFISHIKPERCQLDGNLMTKYFLRGLSYHKMKNLKEIIINKIYNINKIHNVHICSKMLL